ncbi:MAG: hypothetical protein WAN65_10355, partial [Candidatus Sulfotelmatobacter sp.]
HDIWNEIKYRIGRDGHYRLGSDQKDPDRTTDYTWSVVRDNRAVGVISWETLLKRLAYIFQAGSPENDAIAQLKGVLRMAEDSIIDPITEKDLAPSVARRILDFVALITEVCISLKDREKQIISEYRFGLSPESLGYNLTLAGGEAPRQDVWLGIHWELWRDKKKSPIWVGFLRGNRSQFIQIRQQLSDLAPEKCRDDWTYIPLSLPIDREKSVVVEMLVEELEKTISRIRSMV